jgi:AAA+ superfamily predicted ATPase
MTPIEEIRSLIRANVPIIWVRTHEEDRFLEDFAMEVVRPLNLDLYIWSAWQGLMNTTTFNPKVAKQESLIQPPTAAKALECISNLDAAKKGIVVVMKDLHTVLTPMEVRMLRDLYKHLTNNNKRIIITSPILAHGPGGSKEGLPPTLEKQIRLVDYILPTHDDIVTHIRGSMTEMQERCDLAGKKSKSKLDYTDEEFDEIGRALRGLTITEINDAFATCIITHQKLDPEVLLQSKRQIVNKSNVLEFINTDESINSVGGLDLLKEYLVRYRAAFTAEAKDYGVEPLKFVICCGIPGVGKSLTAKALGSLYKLPLIKFDIGRVFGGIVGASEANTRASISQLEAMAPAVCWIDELEKGMSGNKSSGQTDGGTTARVFGTLLTAIQEGLKDVVIFATANDVSALPPELLRRANEIFFVGFPSSSARWEIFSIHLKKRGRDISKFEKQKEELLQASEKYTGAEIEKAITDAIARAFYDKSDDVKAEHILAALEETKPISKVMELQIKELEDWARGHARFASSEEEREVVESNNSVVNRLKDLN